MEYNDQGNLILRNVTISENEGGYGGGGIFVNDRFSSASITNSIIANNTANIGADCSGTITSAGYNIIGDAYNCSFISATGDQIDINPKIGPLQDYGGATLTHFLYQESPAIDAGNPEGCLDHLGNPLTTDQRGFPRPLDGNNDGTTICDIGTYEVDPQNLPPHYPEAFWYVTKNGIDSNNCLSPTAPCKTINAAINKANPGETVFVSAEIYTSASGNQVVSINKNINLDGGWNAEFTEQDGISTIDGNFNKRGITILNESLVNLTNFDIRNGVSNDYEGGGGIYVSYRAKAKIKNCMVQNNQTSGKGAGIYAAPVTYITLTNSWVHNNHANDNGGGIFHSGSNGGNLILNNSIVSNNITAIRGGGISGGIDGTIEIKNSWIINNETIAGSSSEGGGIYSFNSQSLYVKDSLIAGNKAPSYGGNEGYGGGIRSSITTIDHSIIRDNVAQHGGGIYNTYSLNVLNSAILNNWAYYGYGGGIYDEGTFYMTNSTVAYNTASMPYTNEGRGGGIYSHGVQISNSTIAHNTADDAGGGIMDNNFVLKNTILAENQAPTSPDCNGTINSAGYNLVGNTFGCTLNSSAGDLINLNAGLSVLYSWGTMALWPDSPAIDAGNPSGCVDQLGDPISRDQIDTVRPLDGNADGNNACDIGAFEYDYDNPPQYFFLPMIIN